MKRKMTSIAALAVFILVIAAVPCNAGVGSGIAQAHSVLSGLWSDFMEAMTELFSPGNPPPDVPNTSGINGGNSASDNGWIDQTGGDDTNPNELNLPMSDDAEWEEISSDDNGWIEDFKPSVVEVPTDATNGISGSLSP